uniref:NADP-dependent oxidoreductase domain-containing protein n=1 Tax=Ciona savignyi TaxID=51511 RepID=H2ZR43_CIOSA
TILGTMEFGRRISCNESNKIIKEFIRFSNDLNQPAELDTALMYSSGLSEKFIGKSDCFTAISISTKANPWGGNSLSKEGIRQQLETSLQRLNARSVDLFYLHAPDYKIPIADTLETVNQLHIEGKFKEFGLSNYSSWQVAEICTICRKNSWIVPTVYQGMYNCITRMVEKELIPCLRYFNIRFYAYNPLAGGILTGKHNFADVNKDEPGRFFGSGSWVGTYRDRFWREANFEFVEKLKVLLQDIYGDDVTVAEAAYRWLYNHSSLNGAKGDGVIIGCSTTDQFNINIKNSLGGKLDSSVVELMDKYWAKCAHNCPDYMR